MQDFPAERLSIFFDRTRQLKKADFFSTENFPPRDLVFSLLILRIGPFKSAEYLVNHYF